MCINVIGISGSEQSCIKVLGYMTSAERRPIYASGYAIKEQLPKDIEEITPDYERFGLDYSIGFTREPLI